MNYAVAHLNAFKASLSESVKPWVGLAPRSWGKDVISEGFRIEKLPADPQSRTDLFKMAANTNVSDHTFATSVLAWGGMKRDHGRSVFSDSSSWLPIVGQLRSEHISSVEAYAKFLDLRSARRLPGMGPAYFTKLIFFAAPSHDGFIMDQWTARSTNLLLNSAVIHTIVTKSNSGRIQHTVSDKNDADIYQKFCNFICKLADELGYRGRESQIEEALFSTGRGKGHWRNYVIRHG